MGQGLSRLRSAPFQLSFLIRLISSGSNESILASSLSANLLARRELIKFMPTDIAEIAGSLRLDFGETARWRREKAAEHPEDSRNIEAAELLDRLAKTIKDVDPTLLDTYGALWDDEVQDSEQHSEMLRLIGFHFFPQTAEEFVKQYIADRPGG